LARPVLVPPWTEDGPQQGADYTDPLSVDTMASTKIERQIWPVVVAHRGASATHPENTLDAFLAAVEAGADYVELDARLTADGVPVVVHDADVSRTTDGTGLVHELTLSQIEALDASGGRGASQEVPTLRRVLDELSGRVGVDIEVKNLPGEPGFDPSREAVTEQVVAIIRQVAFEGPLLVSSFNWMSIERSRQLAPDVPTGFITSAAIDAGEALGYARAHGHAFVLPQAPAVFEAGPAFVRAAHETGIRIGAWTVDDPQAIERLFDMGVDAVATNDPAVAVPIRDRFRRAS
jgi:glycerophosphoryl diester phosphodiesterase